METTGSKRPRRRERRIVRPDSIPSNVCSDRWQPDLKVIAKRAAGAVHVLDRFPIMTHLSKAIDAIRAEEVKVL